ncbi:hypothetical protein M2G63_22360 [Vibrio vulnificus]|nr:BRO family protein [Vibrio vulnificus]MCU8540778.1 hypothetical protein [Vibrio vulnificus]MCU8545191.1 hypothetical protein [Vibrio vulnificus]
MKDFFTLKYQGDHVIRTFYAENRLLLICLKDVLRTLRDENKKLNGDKPSKSMLTLLKAQLKVLDSDEFRNYEIKDPETGAMENEICVTEPGLYRILSHDTTPAGKAFQRWIFHDVITSIREYKQYPPPENTGVQTTNSDFSDMEVTDQSLQMIVHVTKGLIETRKDVAKLNQRVTQLESRDKLHGLVCMDEFMNNYPEIKFTRESFLSACANWKLKLNGKHEIVSSNSDVKQHYFDIETLSAAKTM